jgi:hypothetical protein
MSHSQQKGTVMNDTEHSAKTASPAGIFATLRAVLRTEGCGAPSRRPLAALAPVALASLFIALAAPSAASAHFVRPFTHQITGICPSPGTCEPSKVIPFGPSPSPLGLAVDSKDDLWVGNLTPTFNPPFPLDGFELSGAFAKALSLSTERPENIAINLSTGAFYSSNTSDGTTVEIFSAAGAPEGTVNLPHGAAGIAVDNSSGPSHGSVYVRGDQERGGEESKSIYKFNAVGAAVNFAGCGTCSEYVQGNEIILPPVSGAYEAGDSLAVDPNDGDIYAVATASEVLEYAPTGELIRAITSAGVPNPPGDHTGGPFGGVLQGLAVDPTNGDLLLSVGYGYGENAVEERGFVDEFDSSGHYLGQITEAEGEPLSGAYALAADSHGNVYLADRPRFGTGTVAVYGPGHFVPGLRLAAATAEGAHPETAVLNGAVNPESTLTPNPSEYGVSDCHFEYVTEVAFNATGFSDLSSGGEKPCEAPGAAEIPKNDEYTSVHAAIAGLASGVTYRYRLSATLAGALGGQSETSSVLAFTAPHAPAVSATIANDITSTFADLTATVNPLGADTTYRFQYLTEQQFIQNGDSFEGPNLPAATPAVDLGPGAPIGSSAEAVLAHIGGLAPATTYRFRLLAENAAGATPGEAVAFTTQPPVSPGLPDNRAYELLTPPDKEGAEDLFRGNILDGTDGIDAGVASESGDRFLLTTRSAFGPFPASGENAYLFSRGTAAGRPEWSYTSLASPTLGVQSVDVGAFDPLDLSRVALNDVVGSANSMLGDAENSLLGPPGGPYTTLHADQPGHEGGGVIHAEETLVVGASSDLGKVVLESRNHALAPAAAGLDKGAAALYESAEGSECTAAAANCPLIDVNAKGEPVSACGAVLGDGIGGGGSYRAVSADGSRVFFTAPAPDERTFGAVLEGKPGCPNRAGENPPQLYLREGGASTVEVSKPEPALKKEEKQYRATYVGAAADGSRVFFRSEAWLTKDHPSSHDTELYEWRAEGVPGALPGAGPGECAQATGCLTRVSAPASAAEGAGVTVVPVVSAQGNAVYFFANAVLAPGASPGDCAVEGTKGACGFYRYDTDTATTAYVATVDRSDFAGNIDCDVDATCPDRSFYTTPDGRYLLFPSGRQLTPDAHNAASSCPDFFSQSGDRTGCAELYRYRYEPESPPALGSLLCVSCNPDGASPTSNAEFVRSRESFAEHNDIGAPRALSDDGSYAFFDTEEGLVPNDTNGKLDVYEWHEGHGISLISSGTDSSPSFFLEASPDGRNVFFGTHSRLVPQDTDAKGDLYDARVCSAEEPCIQPPLQKEGLCEADACSHPAPAPNDATPSSLTFTGPGDLVSELSPPPAPKKTTKTVKCKKPKRLSHNQCVKPKRRAKKATKANRASNDRRPSR